MEAAIASASTSRAAPRRIVFGSLNGLRFILAIWIAWFHVGHMFDDAGMGSIALLRMGAARVDIFFVLSGFVLTHVYWNRSKVSFSYVDFLVARLARIYPLYLFALALVACYIFAGSLVGKSPENPYPLSDLIASLFFLQSFGVTETNAWNFPAWAVSAEIGGYLLFPVFLAIANLLKRMPWVMLAVGIFSIIAAELFSRHYFNLPLNTAVTDWGALRGAIMIFCGLCARVAYSGFTRGREGAIIATMFGILIAGASAINEWGLPLIGLGASFMIMGLARLDHMHEPTGLSHPVMQRLGDYSYAVFLLHAPIYTLTVEILSMAGITFHPTLLTSFLMVVMVTIIAVPVTNVVEKPARKYIRRGWENLRHQQLRHAGL